MTRGVGLVVSLLALFLALGGWGYAATGASVVLGKTNRSPRTTGLASGVKRAPTLAVTNTGGAIAASFFTRPGIAPFRVNSGAKVVKLNADQLDGIDGSALQRRVTGTCAAGSAIRVIDATGGVSCQSTGGGGAAPANPAWSLTGNSGTAPGTDYLGTKDGKDLVVKTNNVERLRVTATGNLGVGTTAPIARLEANGAAGGIGLLGTSTTRGVVGRLGAISCPGSYAVGGCGSSGIGVFGDSTTRGVVGTLGGTSCAGTYAVGGCGSSSGNGVFGSSVSAIGVFGTSSTRGVVGTLGSTSCPGTYGVGGCSAAATGVQGRSGTGDGVVGITTHPAGGTTAAAVHAINTSNGDIFIGEASAARKARINGDGRGYFNGGTQQGGADYAESMRTTDDPATLEPGDVLAIDPNDGRAVRKSRSASSALLVGVYSTKPTILAVADHGIDDSLAGEVPVAMLGVVPTKVSAENGPVNAGDLLTTASRPGYAMKATPVVVNGVAIYPTGAILGKALGSLAKGSGVIDVLVTLR